MRKLLAMDMSQLVGVPIIAGLVVHASIAAIATQGGVVAYALLNRHLPIR
ncbi:hypothetical protein [Pedobacter foliorum]|nr:hypothetical protein [Pedobacter foliorum]